MRKSAVIAVKDILENGNVRKSAVTAGVLYLLCCRRTSCIHLAPAGSTMRDCPEMCGKVRSVVRGLPILAKCAQKCGISEAAFSKALPTDELCGKVRKDEQGLQKKVLQVREEKRSPFPPKDSYVELSQSPVHEPGMNSIRNRKAV